MYSACPRIPRKSKWAIYFQPSHTDRPGAFRQIELSTSRRKARARARSEEERKSNHSKTIIPRRQRGRQAPKVVATCGVQQHRSLQNDMLHSLESHRRGRHEEILCKSAHHTSRCRFPSRPMFLSDETCYCCVDVSAGQWVIARVLLT